MWDVRSGLVTVEANPVMRACSLTGRGLDSTEWQHYIPDLEYQDTCGK
jgi:hypothetical protein